MGGASSTESVNEPILAAKAALGPTKVSKCKDLFAFAQSDGTHRGVRMQRLCHAVGILPSASGHTLGNIGAEIRRQLSPPGKDSTKSTAGTVSEADFLLLASWLLAEDSSHRRRLYFRAMAPYPDDATADDVHLLLQESVEASPVATDARTTVLNYLQFEALRKPGKEGSRGETFPVLSEDSFMDFLDRCPCAQAMLDDAFVPPKVSFKGALARPASMQSLANNGGVLPPSRLIDPGAMLMLDWALPASHRGAWLPLFSSQRDGASYHRLRQCILDKGSTVLLIKDTENHVFGAFAADSWKDHPVFYGSDHSFLFGVHPELRLYRASHQNANYMYMNHSQETLPNGLGMGGQFDYFGLFIANTFDQGHCRGHPLSSTYTNPVLASSSDFKIRDIEVWRVGPPPASDEDENDTGGNPRSVLDGNGTEKALLELAGKSMRSEGLREPIEEEEVQYRADGKVKRPVY
eukprot:m.773519 g.773519  ORF g.773519 m.773519 type:complete len:464 (+) comp23253_c0_seq3:556-1947(+)